MKLLGLTLIMSAFAACSPKGACLMGSTHASCEQDETKSYCDQGSANEFHPGATCASLGYTDQVGKTWAKK